MTALAPHLTAFFQERLPVERRASSHTSDSYAYAFKLLLQHASERLKVAPSQLQLEQLDAPLIVSFLNHLETARANGPAPETSDWPRSSPSCTLWNFARPRRWSKFGASSRFRPRKRTHG